MPLSSAILARAFGREAFGPTMGLMLPIAIPLLLAAVFIGRMRLPLSETGDALLAQRTLC